MSKRGPLTPEERQKYIDDGGGSCPYCGDGDYYGDSFECESSTVWQNLTCLACHRTWQDVYKLVDCSDEFTYDEEIDNEDSDPDGDQSQPKDSETVPPV